MRPLEILLSLVNLAAFLCLTVTPLRAARWSCYAAPVAVVLSAAQALVNDAIRSIQAEMPVLDTVNIRNDLIAMYRTALSSLIERPLIRPLYLKLFGELHSNPAVFQVFCVN